MKHHSAPFTKTDAILELLDEVQEYLEERADADGRSDGSFIPNDAMRLLIQVKYAVALLKQEKAA